MVILHIHLIVKESITHALSLICMYYVLTFFAEYYHSLHSQERACQFYLLVKQTMKFSSKRPINDSLYGYGSHKLVIKANFVLTLNGSVNSPFEPLLTTAPKKENSFSKHFLTKRHDKTRPNRPLMRGSVPLCDCKMLSWQQ